MEGFVNTKKEIEAQKKNQNYLLCKIQIKNLKIITFSFKKNYLFNNKNNKKGTHQHN